MTTIKLNSKIQNKLNKQIDLINEYECSNRLESIEYLQQHLNYLHQEESLEIERLNLELN